MNSVVHLIDSGGEDSELILVLFGPKTADLDNSLDPMCRRWLLEMGETDPEVLDAGFVKSYATDAFVKAAFECKRRGYLGESPLSVFVWWLVKDHGWQASDNVWEYSLDGGDDSLFGCSDFDEWKKRCEAIDREWSRIREARSKASRA